MSDCSKLLPGWYKHPASFDTWLHAPLENWHNDSLHWWSQNTDWTRYPYDDEEDLPADITAQLVPVETWNYRDANPESGDVDV